MNDQELKKITKLHDNITELNRKINMIEDLMKDSHRKTLQLLLDDTGVRKTLIEDEVVIVNVLSTIMEYYECEMKVLLKRYENLMIVGEI